MLKAIPAQEDCQPHISWVAGFSRKGAESAKFTTRQRFFWRDQRDSQDLSTAPPLSAVILNHSLHRYFSVPEKLFIASLSAGAGDSTLAPAQHLPAAEAAVTTKDDFHLRPLGPKLFGDQRKNSPCMPCFIGIRWLQISAQQLWAAENV